MKKVKYVELCDGFHHYLEEVGTGRFKLGEISGEIIFSETMSTGHSSCLELRLEDCNADIQWQSQSKMPIPAVVGQILRGFYAEKSDDNVICLSAYELFDKDEVLLTRASNSKKYKFIEAE